MTVTVSFEVFPPKTEAGLTQLASTISRLDALNPRYISVTFGAGGSAQHRSFDAIAAVTANTTAPVAGHLTCVGVPASEVDAVIDRYETLGISHIVALRGDPPEGIDAPYTPHPDGYQRTSDLVSAIKAHNGNFKIAVSAYPEKHPQSPSTDHDLDVLAEKVAAGAELAMTQMFFDNGLFLTYRDLVAARGIDVALVPGIFPIHSFGAVAGFAAKCGATIPSETALRFDGLDDNPIATAEVAADVAAEQILELAAEGVEHVHLYTLNKPDLALAVCERLGITSDTPSHITRNLTRDLTGKSATNQIGQSS